MKVIIRVDASIEIGTGHVIRCLTLADELRNKGADVYFICRDLPGNLSNFINEKDFTVFLLPKAKNTESDRHVNWELDAKRTIDIIRKLQKVDLLIVDHYALDKRWEKEMRTFVNRIMVIDDLANRPHDCDLLLDQNFYKNLENRYEGLLGNHCIKLLGSQYVLLRAEFKKMRKKMGVREGTVGRILIFFGGSDPTNETIKSLKAIKLLNRIDINVDVVVGASNPWKENIKKVCVNLPNVIYHYQINNMAELMLKADLSIGAGGSTIWERCYLGLPSITIITADNQREIVKNLEEAGALINLEWHENVSEEDIRRTIDKLLTDSEKVINMSKNALNVVGGQFLDHQNKVTDFIFQFLLKKE